MPPQRLCRPVRALPESGFPSHRANNVLKHLTLADEIVVLMLRDDTGAIRPECASVASMAIAGGILMELALLGRIDTDHRLPHIAASGDDGCDGGKTSIDLRHARSRPWLQCRP
jgi:Golgi phosphoprotein 3 (GPP34)